MPERDDCEMEIADLAPEQELTPEEKELLAGAGRWDSRLNLESMEARKFMDAAMGAALATTVVDDGPTAPAGEVYVMPTTTPAPPTVVMPLALRGSPAPVTTNPSFHIINGQSDVSAVVPVLDQYGKPTNYAFVAVDKTTTIYLIDLATGNPVGKGFDTTQWVTNSGGLHDLEGVTVVKEADGNTYAYWTTSGGVEAITDLSKHNDTVCKTKIVGSGENASLEYVGHVQNITDKIYEWAQTHKEFTVRTTAGTVKPLWEAMESAAQTGNKDWFNIEGVTIDHQHPGGAYIALRSAVTADGGKAILIPVTNFTKLFEKGNTEAPAIGEPIKLSLGDRGFRDIVWSEDLNSYLIIGGGHCDGQSVASVLFQWDGKSDTATPLKYNGDNGLMAPDRGTMSIEAIGSITRQADGTVKVQVFADDGSSKIHGKKDSKGQALPEAKRYSNWADVTVTNATVYPSVA